MRREGRVDVLGVSVDPVTAGELEAEVLRLSRRGGGIVLNANAHCLNILCGERDLRDFFAAADVVFCDGAGVRLGAAILGRRLPPRITYADWLPRLADLAEEQNLTLFFLGARPGIAEEARRKLLEAHPGLQILGARHGFFDHRRGSPENEAVVAEITASRPDVLLLGLGMPLQERWLMENYRRMDFGVALTGGAVFDYASGRLRRGPRLLTDNGFEWLARLLVEPRRLWRRYLLGNPLFLARVLGQKWRENAAFREERKM